MKRVSSVVDAERFSMEAFMHDSEGALAAFRRLMDHNNWPDDIQGAKINDERIAMKEANRTAIFTAVRRMLTVKRGATQAQIAVILDLEAFCEGRSGDVRLRFDVTDLKGGRGIHVRLLTVELSRQSEDRYALEFEWVKGEAAISDASARVPTLLKAQALKRAEVLLHGLGVRESAFALEHLKKGEAGWRASRREGLNSLIGNYLISFRNLARDISRGDLTRRTL